MRAYKPLFFSLPRFYYGELLSDRSMSRTEVKGAVLHVNTKVQSRVTSYDWFSGSMSK